MALFDTWGGSWGTSWATSWFREEPTPPEPTNIVDVLGNFTSPQTLGTLKTIQINGIFKSGETTGKLK